MVCLIMYVLIKIKPATRDASIECFGNRLNLFREAYSGIKGGGQTRGFFMGGCQSICPQNYWMGRSSRSLFSTPPINTPCSCISCNIIYNIQLYFFIFCSMK